MRSVQLIHNPGAGVQKFEGSELRRLLEENGYDCGYLSTKEEGWKDLWVNPELLIIAGGDGTIRKVTEEVLKTGFLDKPARLAVLPMGTANNIAKALGTEGDIKNMVASWRNGKTKGFDVGRVWQVPGQKFFLESFGYGIFPYLMMEMKKLKQQHFKSPAGHLSRAWELLHHLVLSYGARQCDFEVDGIRHSGKFLLAEIMNTPFIGPNLHISPQSDPGDGALELVLVGEQHREKFAAYILGKQMGQELSFSYQTIKGKHIRISWEGTHVHVDDQIVKLEKGAEVQVQVRKRLLEFLVPG